MTGGETPKRGRPNELGESKQIGIRISYETCEELIRLADAEELTMSGLLRLLIADGIASRREARRLAGKGGRRPFARQRSGGAR